MPTTLRSIHITCILKSYTSNYPLTFVAIYAEKVMSQSNLANIIRFNTPNLFGINCFIKDTFGGRHIHDSFDSVTVAAYILFFERGKFSTRSTSFSNIVNGNYSMRFPCITNQVPYNLTVASVIVTQRF